MKENISRNDGLVAKCKSKYSNLLSKESGQLIAKMKDKVSKVIKKKNEVDTNKTFIEEDNTKRELSEVVIKRKTTSSERVGVTC